MAAVGLTISDLIDGEELPVPGAEHGDYRTRDPRYVVDWASDEANPLCKRATVSEVEGWCQPELAGFPQMASERWQDSGQVRPWGPWPSRGSVAAAAGTRDPGLEALCGHWQDTKGSSYDISLSSKREVVVRTRRPNGEEKTSTGLIRIAPGFDGRPALLWGRPAGGKQYVAALQGETSVVWTPDTGHGFVWHRVAGDDARTPVIDGGPAQFVAV
mmetsp:Transcript_125707/g.402052  ORF Transcript_125707/g.402052 Transcript_125707/m.402052 type:complete len:215 (-) Transcript_125707:48-692(-)